MDEEKIPQEDCEPEERELSSDKQPWQEPKLAFVEPKLTKHGELTAVTGQGFFGTFMP